jgi:ribosome-associated protein
MEEEEQFVSKSERKRQATHLQKLGSRLSELKDSDLAQLALPDKLSDAIADYRRFPSREARRRQLQYIGKLMRNVDVDSIQLLLDQLDRDAAANSQTFHALEQWRQRLIDDPDGLTAYLNEYPNADRQRLRQQLQKLRRANGETQQKTAARELFRLLREFS